MSDMHRLLTPLDGDPEHDEHTSKDQIDHLNKTIEDLT